MPPFSLTQLFDRHIDFLGRSSQKKNTCIIKSRGGISILDVGRMTDRSEMAPSESPMRDLPLTEP